MAAPTAAPTNPISAIGVSRTRPEPNSVTSPLVERVGPPQASLKPRCSRPAAPATSSPMTTMLGSRRISWRMARFSASGNVRTSAVSAVLVATGAAVIVTMIFPFDPPRLPSRPGPLPRGEGDCRIRGGTSSLLPPSLARLPPGRVRLRRRQRLRPHPSPLGHLSPARSAASSRSAAMTSWRKRAMQSRARAASISEASR